VQEVQKTKEKRDIKIQHQ